MADRLLRHPVPYINESIGNYVLRLCSENSCEVNQISDLIGLSRRGIESYYRGLREKHITKFSELTDMPIKEIEDMTANRFFFNEFNDYNRTEACVCPKCYRERPYERIHWKNKLIKVCMDHEIYLVDECPRCKEKITSNILFNGKCDCDLIINDFKYAKCVNRYVLHNQNTLYQIFNMKSRVPLKECDLLYNTLSGEDYCNLLNHLQNLAALYAEDLIDLGIFFENDGGFKNNIIAAWIMFEWPANLTYFLNILNCLDIKYINRSSFEVDNDLLFESVYTEVINDRFRRIFNPLECLKLKDIYHIFFGNKEIYQPIMNYYYENINVENAKMKMDNYIYLNNYVELDIASKIFFDLYNSDINIKKFVKYYFHVYNFFNKEYLDLAEVFDFFNEIKKYCSISFSDIKEITNTYTSYLNDFQYFNNTLSYLIHLNRKLKIRIDPIYFSGLLSIHFELE